MIILLYTVKVRLYPSSEQSEQLLKIMEQFNSACNVISKVAFDNKTFSKIKLQQLCYYDIRKQFNLSAQMVVRAIGKVAESYSDKNKRDSQHFFKPHGAIVYDTVCEYHSNIINNALRIKPEVVVDGFLGVDLGIAKIATTFDGKYYSSAKVKNLRRRNFKLRQKLQAKGTKSAKRLLKRRHRKESRFATDVKQCDKLCLYFVRTRAKCRHQCRD